jgi:4-oxalocrotonate tautomerase
MPVITIQAIKGVVLTNDEQKRELLQKMTDAFIGVVGEVARPYTYCIIQETPLYEWSVAGRPLPDLPFLYGPEYGGMHQRANEIMRAFTEEQQVAEQQSGADAERAARANEQWRSGAAS